MNATISPVPAVVLPCADHSIVLSDQDQTRVDAMQLASIELTGESCTPGEAVSVALETHAELTNILGFDAVLFAASLAEINRGDYGAEVKEATRMLTAALLQLTGTASGYWQTA